jgi:hypothetical protein
MTDQPQGLVMPKNPARALQELHRQQMEQPPTSTASDTASSTDSSTGGSTDALHEVSTQVSHDVLESVRHPAQTSVRTAAQEDGRQSVRERIRTKATREPTVRITIDVPESLHARLKEYCLANRVESLRGLTLALYEEFLTSEEA